MTYVCNFLDSNRQCYCCGGTKTCVVVKANGYKHAMWHKNALIDGTVLWLCNKCFLWVRQGCTTWAQIRRRKATRRCYCCGTSNPRHSTNAKRQKTYYPVWTLNKPTDYVLCRPCYRHLCERKYHTKEELHKVLSEAQRKGHVGRSPNELARMRMSISKKRWLKEHPEWLAERKRRFVEIMSRPSVKQKKREALMNIVYPTKDTKIERKMERNLLDMQVQYDKHVVFKTSYGFHKCDFFIKPNIVIECDGEYWHTKITKGLLYDFKIDDELEKQGYKVMRFWQYDIDKNIHWVRAQLSKVLLSSITKSQETLPFTIGGIHEDRKGVAITRD